MVLMMTRFNRVGPVARRDNPRNAPSNFDSLAKPKGSVLNRFESKKAAKSGLLSSFAETKLFMNNLNRGRRTTRVTPLVCIRSLVDSIGEERAALLFRGVKGKTQLSGLFNALSHPDKRKNHPMHDAKMGKLVGGMIKGMPLGVAEEFILNAETNGTAFLIKKIGANNIVKLVRAVGAKEFASIMGTGSARTISELVNGVGLGKTIRLIQHAGSPLALRANFRFFTTPVHLGNKARYFSEELIQTVNKVGPEKVGDLIKFLDAKGGSMDKTANLIYYLGHEKASELLSKSKPLDLALRIKADSPYGVAVDIRKIGVDAFLKE